MSGAVAEITSTLQSAHINRAPSPRHDLNPSTAASTKVPVRVSSSSSSADHDDDEVPLSALRPVPRRPALPPLPDLRFEQSYLASLQGATSGWGVAWITVRDQVVMPLTQGVVWTLALAGWRYFNRDIKFSGRSVGARIRRWWWGVNDWKIPAEGDRGRMEWKDKRAVDAWRDVQGVGIPRG